MRAAVNLFLTVLYCFSNFCFELSFCWSGLGERGIWGENKPSSIFESNGKWLFFFWKSLVWNIDNFFKRIDFFFTWTIFRKNNWIGQSFLQYVFFCKTFYLLWTILNKIFDGHFCNQLFFFHWFIQLFYDFLLCLFPFFAFLISCFTVFHHIYFISFLYFFIVLVNCFMILYCVHFLVNCFMLFSYIYIFFVISFFIYSINSLMTLYYISFLCHFLIHWFFDILFFFHLIFKLIFQWYFFPFF